MSDEHSSSRYDAHASLDIAITQRMGDFVTHNPVINR